MTSNSLTFDDRFFAAFRRDVLRLEGCGSASAAASTAAAAGVEGRWRNVHGRASSKVAQIAIALIHSVFDGVAAEFVDATAATITLFPVEILPATGNYFLDGASKAFLQLVL